VRREEEGGKCIEVYLTYLEGGKKKGKNKIMLKLVSMRKRRERLAEAKASAEREERKKRGDFPLSNSAGERKGRAGLSASF